jgi:hypothetical protein
LSAGPTWGTELAVRDRGWERGWGSITGGDAHKSWESFVEAFNQSRVELGKKEEDPKACMDGHTVHHTQLRDFLLPLYEEIQHFR